MDPYALRVCSSVSMCCPMLQVLWNKERGADALSNLLYGPVESGGLGLVPAVDTAKGK